MLLRIFIEQTVDILVQFIFLIFVQVPQADAIRGVISTDD